MQLSCRVMLIGNAYEHTMEFQPKFYRIMNRVVSLGGDDMSLICLFWRDLGVLLVFF